MKTIILIINAMICLVLVAGCNDGAVEADDGPSEETLAAYRLSDENAAKVESELVDRNTDFAVAMFKSLALESEGENIVCSPVSVSVALAMTLNGAVDETFDGMQQALSLAGMTMEDINQQFQSLLLSLEHADEDVVLTLADSIWLADYPVEEPFVDTVEEWYLSGVYDADSPGAINAWIEEKTGGRITDVIDELPPNLVMYLVNAIYFKGAWTTTFDEEDTHTAVFTRTDGVGVDVDMMALNEMTEYTAYSDGQVTGVRLPYGRGKIAFYAFAPSEMESDATIDDFLGTLDGETLTAALGAFAPVELGGVRLPRFKIEYKRELDDILKALGMEAAYSGGFDKMGGEDIYLGKVQHKAFIEVTEAGTEAAAATAVEMNNKAAALAFVADKPFLFLIRDDRNGTILFMGKVEDPTAG
jgi:serine protease inhibitor